MTGKEQTVVRGGASSSSLLGIAFVVLKLTEVIDWSWWWVLAPFWGAWFVLCVAAVFVVVAEEWSKS